MVKFWQAELLHTTSPRVHSTRLRVCVHNVPVCTGTTRTWRVTHDTPHRAHTSTQHNKTTRPQRHTETDRDRQRHIVTQREDRDRERREETRVKIHFQCGGAWPFLVDVRIFGLFRLRTILWPVKCPVRFIFDFFQCTMAGQNFLNICELFILCSYSIHFFGHAVTVSKFSELFRYAATVFLNIKQNVTEKVKIPQIPYTDRVVDVFVAQSC